MKPSAVARKAARQFKLSRVIARKAVAAGLMAAMVCPLAMSTGGCEHPPPQYGTETALFSPLRKRQVWAIAPTVNLSGQKNVDPLLQSDLVYQQLQQVQGVTVVPVDRVVEVYAALKIDGIQSEAQANIVCDLLGCDGLIVPTVTAYDAYNPPKMAAAVQLFVKPPNFSRPASVAPRDLVRQAAPVKQDSLPADGRFFQSVGMFDAANGSVRSALLRYAGGRNDPLGPYAAQEYFVNMDRYCGFVYCLLISDLINSPKLKRALG